MIPGNFRAADCAGRPIYVTPDGRHWLFFRFGVYPSGPGRPECIWFPDGFAGTRASSMAAGDYEGVRRAEKMTDYRLQVRWLTPDQFIHEGGRDEHMTTSIKHLKPGDPVILRRINRYGRYEFRETTIDRIAANVAKIDGMNFRRDTNNQSGDAEPLAFSRWEAFPANDYTARTQLEQYKAGTLPPVIHERKVRLIRAIDRLNNTPVDEVEGDLDAVEHLIGWFGRDDDFKETDDGDPRPESERPEGTPGVPGVP